MNNFLLISLINHQKNFFKKAYQKNVILASPGNIMAIIKIVETIKSKEKQIENVDMITKSASKLFDKYATLKAYLKKVVTSYRTHGKNLEEAINNSWGGKDSLEKQMINLKNKHGLNATKNIETTSLEEDKIRDVNDPLSIMGDNKKGGINVIDLANIHSCPFVATQDLGCTFEDGTFSVLGRFSNADVRGCNLLIQ